MSTTVQADPNPRPSHGIFSRITTRWLLLLFLWLSYLLPVMYLIHQFVEPTFRGSQHLARHTNFLAAL